jgi:hypothetical protein
MRIWKIRNIGSSKQQIWNEVVSSPYLINRDMELACDRLRQLC